MSNNEIMRAMPMTMGNDGATKTMTTRITTTTTSSLGAMTYNMFEGNDQG